MKKNNLFVKMLALFSILFLFSCGNKSTEKVAQDPKNTSTQNNNSSMVKPVVLKFASNLKKNDLTGNPAGIALKYFVDSIEKRTDGHYVVKLYTDSTLGKSAEEVLGGCQNGSFEMLNYALGSWGEYTKAFIPMNFSYLYTDSKVVHSLIDGKIGEKMRADCEKDTGIKVLSFLDVGFRQITSSNKLIKTPEDMKDFKIRTMTDPYQIAAMKALGASPTPINYSELFTALQQKLVDGQENPIFNILTSKIGEVQKYMTLSKHNYTFTSIAISSEVFNKLPKDIQEIFLEEARNAELLSRKELEIKEKEALDKLKESMEVYAPSHDELLEFQNQAKSSWSLIEKDIGSDYYNEILEEVKKIEKELDIK